MFILPHYSIVLHLDVFDSSAEVDHFALALINRLTQGSERVVRVLVGIRVGVRLLDFTHSGD